MCKPPASKGKGQVQTRQDKLSGHFVPGCFLQQVPIVGGLRLQSPDPHDPGRCFQTELPALRRLPRPFISDPGDPLL